MKQLFTFVLAAMLIGVSCSDPQGEVDSTPKGVVFASGTEMSAEFGSSGGSKAFVFTTDLDWEVTASVDWISVTPSSGTPSMKKFTVKASANDSFEERNGTVTMTTTDDRNYIIEVKQAAEKETFTINSNGEYVVKAAGGEVEVKVTTNLEYTVEIPAEAKEWLSVADTRAVREETLTFTVAKNETFDERSATVELKGADGKVLQSIVFKQKGEERVFDTDGEGNYVVEAVGGEVEVKVTTNLEYTVEIPAEAKEWLSVADTRAVIREETLTFTVAKNETLDERSATVELKGAGGEVLRSISFKQKGEEKVFDTDGESNYVVEAVGGEVEVKVTTNLEYTVEIPAEAKEWLSVADTRAVIREETLTFTVAKNKTLDERSVKVIFSDAKGDISKSVKITQLGSPLYCVVPNDNEILYITTDGEVLDISDIYLGSTTVIDHTYEDGIGRITCSSDITQINGFFGCTTLEQIAIPDSVTEIGYEAFENCDSLTGITIPDSVTTIGAEAFLSCSSLTSVTIPDSVTEIGYSVFEDCTSLESITIGKGVTSIGWYALEGCTGELIVNCNIPSVSDYRDGFFFGSKFTKVTIGDSVTKIGNNAFCNCTSLTSITIPNSVNTIGDSAFCNCTSLTSITIPDSVTEIGKYAFLDCTSLTSITIPDSVTEIGFSAFENCTSLTSITIPDSVTKIGGSAFRGCTSLTSITIPDSVTSIEQYAFADCSSLTSVTIPDSVTTIVNLAFAGCSSLTSVTIPDSVTEIGYSAFDGCTSLERFNGKYASEDNRCLIFDGELVVFAYAGLTEYAIPDSVTSIGKKAFADCGSLTSITIPDSVTTIGDDAFEYCDSLTSMTIPESVTSIGDYAFRGCTGELIVNCNIRSPSPFNTPPYSGVFAYADFTKVTIGDSVTSIGEEAFYYCTSLESITIGKGVTWIGEDAFLECTGELIINCNVPSKNSDEWSEDTFFGAKFSKVTIGDNATSIGGHAFDNCTSLESITIGNGVTTIGDYAFRDCTSLTSVTIPDSVTTIGDYAFLRCTSLKSVTIGESVTEIGGSAFHNCTSLKSINIPESVTEIGGSAFKYCSSLTSITIPDSVTEIGGSTFEYCKSLKSVTIGESVTEIRGYAFRGCTSLTSVNIPESVTEIGEYAFLDCTSLERVDITDIVAWCGISFYYGSSNPLSYAHNLYLNGVLLTELIIPDSVTEIGKCAFLDCTSLTNVTIPDSVTSIGDNAFNGCTSLVSVTIGDSVTEIGNYAFYNCTSLERVYCKPTTPPSLGTNAFVFNGRWYATIYVPVAWRYDGVAGWDVFNIVSYDFSK